MEIAYDAADPPVDLLCASDALFISAYTDGKFATPLSTIQAYRKAGKGVVANHERGQTDLSGGYLAGVIAANQAIAGVLDWDYPQDGSTAIYYSYDASIAAANFSAISDAFDGINATHAGRFKAGIYGEGALIDYLIDNNRVQVLGWLSASSSYPGYNPGSLNVGMYQLVGSDIPGADMNVVTQSDKLGVWWPNKTIKGDNMQLYNTAQGVYFRDANGFYAPVTTLNDVQALQAVGAIGANSAPQISDALHQEFIARSNELRNADLVVNGTISGTINGGN